ncbi:RND family efflux transporter MFP subunit [Chryseobacterium daecheongense]|uniref:RND family efflux transporter MFP subunit n=1 Tax=Chryseobacterium daecheongense TaxID=192389 RepID=A0ABY2FWQ3_9FLAO|nr:efflux RND transporter periplasmic adaptor subunit [Chryseobacterium daecheongense]TDX92975.1 RND family efflux transporter MFP subunit [Chryseobacterium daecheongense]
MTGTEIVIDLSNSSSPEGENALRFFETAGKNLVKAELNVSVKHHIVLSIVGSCSSDKKKSAQNADAPISVTVSHTTVSSEGPSAIASGKLVAKNSVNVSTRMMGYITSMKAEVGQNVRAGQLLVSINAADIQAKGGQANAQTSQAQASYNIARKDYERFQNLYKSQSTSQKELDDMRARYEMAQAGLQAAQQMKNEVNAQYSYINVTAPISGTVTAKFAEQGNMASPRMPLLTIESPSSLQAQVLVSEQNITMISNGMPVDVIFPKNVMEPMVKTRSIDDVPMLGLTLWSDNPHYNDFQLRQIGEELSSEIKKIKDVSLTKTIGGRNRQLQVILDKDKMALYLIS